MALQDLHFEQRADARAALAVMALVAAVLAGCAAEFTLRPHRTPVDAAPFVGVFTGEFVDGKPVYRFPTIEVVGSRRSSGPGI